MKTTTERIREGLLLRDLKQSDLVERTGISKGALSSYINGRYIPKQTNIYLIAKALNVNESWLMGFDVPMERTGDSDRAEKAKQPKVLEYYNTLNDIGKHEAAKRVEELSHIEKYTISKHLLVDAAHERTDIDITEEMRKYDDDIMNDENF